MLPILDLETSPDPAVLPLLAEELAACEAIEDDITAPANYKDPAKIAAYIETKREALQKKAQKARAERITSCAVDINELRIVALGYEDDDGSRVLMAHTEKDERDLLAEWWLAAKAWAHAMQLRHGDVLCAGFCCRTFDLPALIRRSQILGVSVPGFIRLDRYRGNVLDLADTLTWQGMTARYPRSLEFYARRFGLIGMTEPFSHGADVLGWVEAGDWRAVEDHLRQDLRVTRALYDRLYPTGV